MTMSFPEFNPGLGLTGDTNVQAALALPTRPGIYRNLFKRLFDITAIALAAPVVVPLVGVLAVIVARDGGKPFYSQMRVGQDAHIAGDACPLGQRRIRHGPDPHKDQVARDVVRRTQNGSHPLSFSAVTLSGPAKAQGDAEPRTVFDLVIPQPRNPKLGVLMTLGVPASDAGRGLKLLALLRENIRIDW